VFPPSFCGIHLIKIDTAAVYTWQLSLAGGKREREVLLGELA